MKFSFGGQEIDWNDVAMEWETYPEVELVWQHPDRLADMSARMVATKSAKVRDELMEAMEPAAVLMSLPTRRDHWRHLHLGGVSPVARLYSLVMLHDEKSHMTQEAYNFLCGVDIPGATLSLSKVQDAADAIARFPRPLDAQEYYRQKALEELHIDEAQKRLGEAFVKMLVEEAKPHLPRMVAGEFEMERVDLPFLDKHVKYQSMRLSIQPTGIRGSLVNREMYSPWFWSPTRTTAWMKGAELAWALQVVSASIWRDACVVRHEFVTERRRSVYQSPPRQSREKKAVTILPRVIRHVTWSSDEERDSIIRQAHTVRQHYRELPVGWQTTSNACESARLYGWPEPPPGWTFVKPHSRGGEVKPGQPTRQVICKGLHVAKLALG